jgi:response regulator RpfG family c-di-GMP phosphodiesterase
VFLDLKLPNKHGLDVLTEIKMSPERQVIPAIIFTTSQGHDGIQRAYRGYANSYAVKPLELDEFMGLNKNTLTYWVNGVVLP